MALVMYPVYEKGRRVATFEFSPWKFAIRAFYVELVIQVYLNDN